MNKLFTICLILSTVSVFSSSCNQNSPEGVDDDPEPEIEETLGDSSEISEIIPGPAAVDSVFINSPFYSFDCCSKEEDRSKDCCCSEVIKKYEELKAESEIELISEVKTKDPIFQICNNIGKWRKEIERIDNPPTPTESNEEGEEEEYDF